MNASPRLALLKLWDFLFWLTILFPLFAGGIWYYGNGIKLELTQLSLPTLVLALFAYWLQKSGVSIREASGVKCLQWLWDTWALAVELRPKSALIKGAIFVGVFFSVASLRRHFAFASGAADLGIFTSALWNLTHGNGYISSLKDGINLFADHQSPIFYLFAPVFMLWPQPEVLLILQGFIFSSGAIAVYGLGKQYLGKSHWALPVLPVLYWSYQPLRNANAFDFHPEITLLPLFLFFLLLAHCGRRSRQILSFLFLMLALATKESAGPVAVGIALAWLLGAGPVAERKRLQFWAFPLGGLGLAVFLINLKVVPQLFSDNYRYMQSYSYLGDGLTGILLSPLMRPRAFWNAALIDPARRKFLFESFAPFAFLPLFAPVQLLASIPGFLMLFLEEGSHRITTGYHYILEPGVGLFWALAASFRNFSNPIQRWLKPLPLSVGLALTLFAFAMHGRSEVFRIRIHSPSTHQVWLRTQLLPTVDPKASLSASGALVPHLAARFWAHHLPKTHRPTGEPLDCVLREESVNNWPLQQSEIEPLAATLSAQFIEEYRCRSFVAYRWKTRDAPCLIHPPPCPN